ncbi:hypothetical protein KIN20_016437 [Parelaphostrongylus tenuis]|uniref:Uncharacterized protein n=1 Tax=Parelaphostrongylus tenuis TaxID=148309 RepID=A0AAD5N5A9_PARTN|nr:hypothetical protein KIN20_016437 [Parelaphostrongylus tenuis]
MRFLVLVVASMVTVKGQDFASFLGPLFAGRGGGVGGGGGGLGNILASFGGGKSPDIGSLIQLGAGFLGKGGGLPPVPGLPPPAPTSAPAPVPAPAPAGGPTNIAVPDYADYEGELPPPGAIDTPNALKPPGSLTWMRNNADTPLDGISTDYEITRISAQRARPLLPSPPPSSLHFTPVGSR